MLQMQEMWVWSVDWKDPLEEEMATHSSILAREYPMNREIWRATGHGVTKSQTWLSIVMLVSQSCLTLCNAWTVAHQAPLYMEFSRQEYWSGLPFTYLGDWACIHCLWNFTLIFITCVTLLLADNLILLNLSTLICKLDDFDRKD